MTQAPDHEPPQATEITATTELAVIVEAREFVAAYSEWRDQKFDPLFERQQALDETIGAADIWALDVACAGVLGAVEAMSVDVDNVINTAPISVRDDVRLWWSHYLLSLESCTRNDTDASIDHTLSSYEAMNRTIYKFNSTVIEILEWER